MKTNDGVDQLYHQAETAGDRGESGKDLGDERSYLINGIDLPELWL